MKSEKEKMLSGELYQAWDLELTEERKRTRKLLHQLNASSPDDEALRHEILQKLIGNQGKDFYIQPPFYCDYGSDITVGDGVFFNFNCTVLDIMPISIGSYTLIGPNVQIYGATHPMEWETRSSGLEYGKPINIGEHVWIGGGAIICPGVTIGEKAVIGAGSVVTRDVPANVFAAGNPCRVIRPLGD